MSMTFLLDTDVLSETSKPRPDPRILEFLKTEERLAIAAASFTELQMGIMLVCSRDPMKAVALSKWYQNLTSGEIPILQTSVRVHEVEAVLRVEPRLRNLIIPPPYTKKLSARQDLLIAATAFVYRAAIATCNVKDYLLINSCHPLPGIYNPREDVWYARMEPLSFPHEQVSADDRELEPTFGVR